MPAVSKSQRRLFGMVRACQKSNFEDCASDEVEKIAKEIKVKSAHDFATTKHKGLPNRIEKKENESKMMTFEEFIKK